MARAVVDGVTLGYDVIGDGARTWVVTPGGRYGRDTPGVRSLAEAVAAAGDRVLVWDRPNCGESDVRFDGETESHMQADALAGLVRHLGCGPALLMGGSGGARVSLLAAARHPDVVAGLAVVWISGGVFGVMNLAAVYCAPSLRAAVLGGMEAVAELPDWAEVVARNPANRDRILGQERGAFLRTMERWMAAYCPRPDEPVPGLDQRTARAIAVPALVFRGGESDWWHPRETSEALARLLPDARLVDPPWPDTEWIDGTKRRARGEQRGPFERWPLLAPQLLAWADGVEPAVDRRRDFLSES